MVGVIAVAISGKVQHLAAMLGLLTLLPVGIGCLYVAFRSNVSATGTPAALDEATGEQSRREGQAFVRNLYGTAAPASQPSERKDLREDQRPCPGCGHPLSRHATQCPKCKERLDPS
jgi:hypothetical protein